MTHSSTDSIVARGEHAALAFGAKNPTDEELEETRPYETLGYVFISGKVELIVDGRATSSAGDA